MIVIVDYALPEENIGRFLIYHFDLEASLRKTRVEIRKELPVLLRAGKILKGIKL